MNKIKKIFLFLFATYPGIVFAQYSTPPSRSFGSYDFATMSLFVNFLYLVFGATGLFAVVWFIRAIIEYLAAGSDEDRIKRGKNFLVASIIAFLISAVGFMLVTYYQGTF